ncbi:HET-domain-containing protein [Cladorrhinum sp. PSN259]|nr:HET-domain-containing protein [Cladorrhinum sp. PSN259]
MDDPTNTPPIYEYQPLDSATQEIRLVHLLPAETFSDSIRLCLVHAAFPRHRPPPQPARDAQLFELLERELSFPWCLEETTSGQLIAFNVVTGQTHLLEDPELQPATSVLSPADEFEPRYEALSYTWGDAGVSEFAAIEGAADGGGVRRLGIRQNLASALRHLRQPTDPRVLWIDAICINQDDIPERNQQVKRMMEIYTLARRVIAWLGNGDESSERALEALRHVGSQLRSTKSGRVIAAPGAAEPRLWRNDTPPSFTPDIWHSVLELVERQWFYRIWCWQEIKLGSRGAVLQCGHVTIRWRDFWLAVLCLHNKDTLPSRHFRERCRHIVFLQYEGESVANLLDTARSKGCADPRDKIYGLLGITPAYFASRVTVDYRRPPARVYKDAFMAHLQATQRLDLLKHCNLDERGDIGGPSWVPDWSRTEFAAPILSEQLSSGISRAWFTYDEEDPGKLRVIGTQYTTIGSVSAAVASKAEDETLMIVKEWYDQLPQLVAEKTAYHDDDMERAFILSLCMNRTSERNPDNHFLSVHQWVTMLQSILRLEPDGGGGGDNGDPLYQKREIANIIQKIRGRRFIVTESGHFGTAPAGARVGDVVSLLLGTYAPIILHPTSSASKLPTELFQVVGECYLHGLSDALGLLGPVPDPWRPIITGDALGRQRQWFLDVVTRRRTLEDPRLPPLPYRGWERAVYERSVEDPAVFERFVHVETGETVNYDPRMSAEALEARGVCLRTFVLV